MALPSWTTLDDDAQGGRTALMIAVSAGDGWENCVAELVRDIKRFGPEKTRAVLQLKEPRNGCTAIHFAASSGAVKLLQIFISECEASVNAKDYASATPLHYAMRPWSAKRKPQDFFYITTPIGSRETSRGGFRCCTQTFTASETRFWNFCANESLHN